MADTKTISIYGQEFEVQQPYNEGHAISAIEAKVLNQVRAENVANNQRKNIKAAIDGGEGAPSMDEARAAFAEYEAGYEFTEAAAGGGSRATLTPLQKEAKKIATALVMKHLKDSGRKKSDVDAEAFAAQVAQLAEDDKVLKIAKRRVKENEELAELAEADEAAEAA
jgi:hypothetical protein